MSAGHVYKMEVLAFSMVSLAFIEKGVRAVSVRGQIGYGLLAGVSVGLMMLEQQDVALLAGLFLAPYAFLRLIQIKMGWARSALFLGLLSVVGLLYRALYCSSPMIKIFVRRRAYRAKNRRNGITSRSGVWFRGSGLI